MTALIVVGVVIVVLLAISLFGLNERISKLESDLQDRDVL